MLPHAQKVPRWLLTSTWPSARDARGARGVANPLKQPSSTPCCRRGPATICNTQRGTPAWCAATWHARLRPSCPHDRVPHAPRAPPLPPLCPSCPLPEIRHPCIPRAEVHGCGCCSGHGCVHVRARARAHSYRREASWSPSRLMPVTRHVSCLLYACHTPFQSSSIHLASTSACSGVGCEGWRVWDVGWRV
jgi:hypothetical protein